MADPEITNQMFIDKNGKHMTRCWNKVTVEKKRIPMMYVVPTDPSQIRPQGLRFCWKPGDTEE